MYISVAWISVHLCSTHWTVNEFLVIFLKSGRAQAMVCKVIEESLGIIFETIDKWRTMHAYVMLS